MSKFKVGDKVRILDGSKIKDYTASWAPSNGGDDGMEKHIGEVHAVISVDDCWTDDRVSYRLEGTTYSWDERGLELVNSTDNGQKIVITTDGKTTTAVLYDGKKRIKDAKAICSPDDTFDFNYGASLALDRLTGFVRGQVDFTLEETESAYFTGKVRCTVCRNDFLTKDKIYEFVNGYSVNDAGNRFPAMTQVKSLDHLNKTLWSTFEEVEENSDWNKFIAGDIGFEMTSDKYDAFLKEVEKRLPILHWAGGEKPTGWKPSGVPKCYFKITDGELCWGQSNRVKCVPWTDNSLDWNKFAHGELEVKVSKEKFDEFMKLCEAKNFTWSFGVPATKTNPWKMYDALSGFARMVVDATGDVPGEYIYVSFVSDENALKWHAKHDEDCDTYEFV